MKHNWLVHHIVNRELQRCFPEYLRGRLIDIGCGEKPYEEMAKPFVTNHLGIDHMGTQHEREAIDAYASADSLPVQNESFDSALCTAVIEHLEEPQRAITECHRVLRPGAHAIFLAPLIWHLHEEPHDFFRFTKYALRSLFERGGFQVVEISALSGFWVTFGQLFVYYLYELSRVRWLAPLRWAVPPAGALIQRAALGLDRLHKAERWTWAYLVVVCRESTGEAR